MNNKYSAWRNHPDYQLDIKPLDTSFSMMLNNKLVVESNQVLLLCEQDHHDIYYFPRQDVKMDLFRHIKTVTFCPYKGDAVHWALAVGGINFDVAAWSYENPFEQVSKITNYIAFYPELLPLLVIN